MKILMVTMSMEIGGAETHILELCRELIARGHEVVLASRGGVYADELEQAGVGVVNLPLNRKDPGSVLRAWRGLARLIREGGFDIVHSHARIPSFILGMMNRFVLLPGGVKFRFVTSAHLDFAVNPLWRRISCWGERVMAVSDDIREYLIREYNYPAGKIYTTINGIDERKFSPGVDFSGVLAKHGLGGSRRRVVYMSRLDGDRVAPAFELIKAAPKLRERYPDLDVIIVGDGGCRSQVEEMAADANGKCGGKVVYCVGGVSNVNEYCACADVFVGVSRSALEAMACGKPVILAGGQGARGIFDESKAGAAFETNFCCRGYDLADDEALFEQICALMDDAGLRERLGEFNRRFIHEHYTVSRMADDYLRMYGDALASPIRFKGAADVLVSGYYGFGNLGDESLLEVIAGSAARAYPGVKIRALTKNPKADSQRLGIECLSRVNFPGIWLNARRAKVLLSGGGSLLQDKTSSRSLRYYAGVMGLAKLAGAKVYVYANGIGPILREENRRLVARALAKADVITVRDSESAGELGRIGYGGDVCVTADPAFLTAADSGAAEVVLGRVGFGGKSFIAVSMRLLDFTESRDGGSITPRDEKILGGVVSAVSAIARERKLAVMIIPMQKSKDGYISRVLSDRLVQRCVECEIYNPISAGELIGVLSRAEFVVGMRLHSIIYAAAAGIPVIGLSYDPKVASFMREIGQEYEIDLAESADSVEALVYTMAGEILLRRGVIVRELKEKSAVLCARAEGDVEMLGELIGR